MSSTDASSGAQTPRRSGGTHRTLLLVAVVAALALAAIVGVAVLRPGEAADVADGVAADTPPRLDSAGRAVGEPLPTATLPALGAFGPADGLQVPSAGEPMVVNFWASWCAPCVNEMPMLQRVADDLGVTMVGIDYIDQADKAVDLARELGIRYPLVTDDEGAFGERVGLLGTPTTLIVDGDGVVRRQLTGELSEQQLRDAIVDVLG